MKRYIRSAKESNDEVQILNQPIGVRANIAWTSTDSNVLDALSFDTNIGILTTLLLNKHLSSTALSTIVDTILNKSLKTHDWFTLMRCGDILVSVVNHNNIADAVISKIIDYARTYPKFKAVIKDKVDGNYKSMRELYEKI